MPDKTLEGDHRCCKKPCTQSIMQKYLQQRETVGEAAAQRKRWKETTGAAKKPCTQSIMQKYLQQRETVGEAAAADEEEEEEEEKQEEQEEEQQEDTEDSGGESGDDKCMVCGEKEEDDVDIEDWVACEMCSHSGYILSAYPPIIHTLYHMQTFIAIFVYSSNFH